MTTNLEPTVSRNALLDGCCPFCNNPVVEMSAIEIEDDVYQDQQCKKCNESWRVYYGPVGIVHGDDYLPAADASTESEVQS